jgi:YebC/PmpR family DNA-binding regulatory protein
MSGHSHWAGIKHKKGVADARRGKLFSKLAKNITVAARQAGGDPDTNLRLKYAIEKARAANMPKDGIERAVKKGTGELEGAEFFEAVYEGYGPGGVAILVEVLTDNRNRTVAEMRKIFERKGGNLGDSGCVAWMFQKKGVIRLAADLYDEESLLEIALEAGAENVEVQGEYYEVSAAPDDFGTVKEFFEQKDLKMESAEFMQVPSSTVPLDAKAGRKVLDMLDELESHDDVQNIYANYDIPDEVFKEIEG